MSLSGRAAAAVNAAQTGEVFLACLTIGDPSDPDVRLVDDEVDLIRGADTYTAYPFTVRLPEERSEQAGQGELIIDNVDRLLVPTLRALTTPVQARIEIVLASSPTTVEVGPRDFQIKSFTFDVNKIRASLEADTPIGAPFPSETMAPATFPGLFQ